MKTREADPIIAELRAIRDEHAARFNYDVAAIFQDLRAIQAASGRNYVKFPTRRVSPDSGDQETP